MSRAGLPFSAPASGAGPIDWDHLRRATSGDEALANEVLGLFLTQTAGVAAAIQHHGLPLAHKLKGSARGIGAWAVAEAAHTFETTHPAASEAAMTALLARIEDARQAIMAHLHKM